MHSTSASLLERLQTDGTSPEAWSEFVELYTPLLDLWADRSGVPPADRGDLLQEVFVVLLRKLPDFRHAPAVKGGFRRWLRTVLTNKWREMNRRKALPVVPNPAAIDECVVSDEVEDISEAEYRQVLTRQALLLMQRHFQPATWRACWEHVVADRPARDVGAELGISAGAVRVASSRVLARLRSLLAGLAD